MKPRDKRVYIKYALMTLFSISTATGTAVLAFQKSLTESFVVLLSSAVLLVSSALLGVSITGSTDNTKRTALLVFSIGVLVLFVGSVAWILFSQNDEEAADGQYAEIITPTKPISSNVTDTENIEEPVSSLNEAVNIETEGEESAVTASIPTLSSVTSVIITPEIINVEPRRPEASAVTASSEIIPDSEIVNITPRIPDSPSLSAVSFTLPEENIIDVEARIPEPCTVEAESLIIPETIDISPRLPSPAVISSETSVRAEAEEVLVTPKLPEMPKLKAETDISNIPEVIGIKVRIPDIPSVKAETYSVINIIPREIPAEAVVISETEMKSQPEIISIEPRVPERADVSTSAELDPEDAVIIAVEPRVPETASIEAETAVEEIPAIIDIESRLPEIAELSASSTIITDPAIIAISPRVPSAPLASAETAISEIPVIVNIPAPEPEVEIIEEEILPEPEPIEAVEETADDFFFGLSPEEADFWASFYIEGEDELEFADGLYYMDLFINGNATGSIEIQMTNGEASLSRNELSAYLVGVITESAGDRIFTNSEDYIPLINLEEAGVKTELDTINYEVKLSFSPEDMPIQILSISGRNPFRRATRPIADGINLEPAVFTLASDYSLTARVNDFLHGKLLDNLTFTFSSSNNARLLDLYFDFSYYMNFSPKYFRFNFGSYRFHVDFPEAMIRLEWGNVSSRLLSPTGTNVGISFEKSYSYAKPGVIRPSQHEELLVIDKPSEVIIYNEGREIYRRTLEIGTYRLRDFILYTGANKITIEVAPLDGSESQIREFDVLYAASLLAPGEVFYGASLVTGRRVVKADSDQMTGTIRLPLWNGNSL